MHHRYIPLNLRYIFNIFLCIENLAKFPKCHFQQSMLFTYKHFKPSKKYQLYFLYLYNLDHIKNILKKNKLNRCTSKNYSIIINQYLEYHLYNSIYSFLTDNNQLIIFRINNLHSNNNFCYKIYILLQYLHLKRQPSSQIQELVLKYTYHI